MKKRIILITMSVALAFAGTGSAALAENTVPDPIEQETENVEDTQQNDAAQSDIHDESATESEAVNDNAAEPDNVEVTDAATVENDTENVAEEQLPTQGISMEETVEDITISVCADEGVFPDGARLSVTRIDSSNVPDENQDQSNEEETQKVQDILSDVEDTRNEVNPNKNVAQSYLFDIQIQDANGNEIEPDTSKGKVSVSFQSSQVEDSNLDTEVYHAREDGGETAIQVMELEKVEDDTVMTDTDSFAYYIVDFTYGELSYTLDGDSQVALSDILTAVGLEGTIQTASSSNDELFTVTQGNDGIWYVQAITAFDTNESLMVTINDVTYEIAVTDDNIEISWEVTPLSLFQSNIYEWQASSCSYVKPASESSSVSTQTNGIVKIYVTNGSSNAVTCAVSHKDASDYANKITHTVSTNTTEVPASSAKTLIYQEELSFSDLDDAKSISQSVLLSQYTVTVSRNDVIWKMTGPAAADKTLSANALLATKDAAVSYTDPSTGKTVTAYNGYISATSGANWDHDATGFVKLLNDNGIKPDGATAGGWRLLNSKEDAEAWYAASSSGSYNYSLWSNVEGTYNSGNDGAYLYSCISKSWYTTIKTNSQVAYAFVIIWDSRLTQ